MNSPKKKPQISNNYSLLFNELAIANRTDIFKTLPPASQHPRTPCYTHIRDELYWAPLDQYIDNDLFPIPETADREGYHGDRHFDWWMSGLRDCLQITDAYQKYGNTETAPNSFFELGAASGRVVRHFLSQYKTLDCWASDICLRHVEWMRNFLSPRLKVFQNTVLPNLPLESNAFDVVAAFSVFTHIDEFELSWITEMRRILKPGGIAYITIHSDKTWKNMEPSWPIYQSLLNLRNEISEYTINEKFLSNPLLQEKTVFRWKTARNYNTNVFVTEEYVRNTWGRFFEICDLVQSGHDYQDVLIMKKPALQ